MEELIIRYGLEVALISVSAIFVVGCFKLIFKKQFAKIEKGSCKTVYETLSIVVAFGLTALWLAVGKKCFDWAMFGKEGALVYSATKVAYSLYENFKLRDLFQVIGKTVAGIFIKKGTSSKPEEGKDNTKTINVI